MRQLLALVFGAAICGGADSHAQEAVQPEETTALVDNLAVKAKTHMVAAANPEAAKVGLEVLSAGGSAADAAVAVQLMLNLVEPQSSGIGGGAFLLYWDASEAKLTTLDGRERAPLAATPEYWFGNDGAPVGWFDAVVGGRSVGVPGTLKLLEEMHGRWGNQPWSGLFEPTIEAARQGFTISPRLEASIAVGARRKLAVFPAARDYFFNGVGGPRKAGTRLINNAFADVLEVIASEGSEPFYRGEIAQSIVEVVKTPFNAGILSLEDLAAYEVIERAPVCMSYRAHEVCGMGPPSSGALTVGQILGQLEAFDLGAMGPTAEAWHLYVEASKRAYADRGLYMADSDFVDMPEGLLNRAYLKSRAAEIDPGTASQDVVAGAPPWQETQLWAPDEQEERPGTSHFVIVDGEGDVVSMTTTIETGFGSRVMVDGFLLNNELTDFSRAPMVDGKPVANRVEGGKRPRSSMAPTIVLKDGAPVLALGSPGGSRIIGYVAKTLIAVLDWGMELQAALDLGHVVNRNGATDVEVGTPAVELVKELEAFGQEVKTRNLNSGLHAVSILPEGLIGAADRRREGVAVGD